MPSDQNAMTTQSIPVFRDRDFTVVSGVAEGDNISFADELVMDDIYHLGAGAERQRLTVALDGEGRYWVGEGSALGTHGNQLYLDCLTTLMEPDGATFEALIMVEVEDGGVADVYMLPLAPFRPKTDYRLVGIDRDNAVARFGEVACVSFARGTHITMASGEQRRIEDLAVGDRVLTRDDGPQAVRWIGQTTLRATGDFAPVLIRKGTLHNEHDLLLSPDHRVFIYQREDRLGAGRPEVLVRVRHLINGNSVIQQDGGFVDYFQLLFDEHQIIYAEGIAAESLLIDPRTSQVLPEHFAGQGGMRKHRHRTHLDYEIQENLLAKPDAADLLKKASSS